MDTIINGGMLTAGGYTNVTRPDLYRTSCTQPIVSQAYPTSGIPQTVFPPGTAVPVEEMYGRSTWYNPAEVGQSSPLDYQQQSRFDNRSPSCAQSATTTQSFRDSAYKAYGY